ncbi:outer membrane beta-barrel protein [Aestuariibaculum marinum]|nr:outer membrane beta-barrel protein [Aestuariibaculum marinum]
MFKYHFGFSYDFFFSGGSSLDYLLNIKNIDDGSESDLDFNNNFRKASYNLVLGFGYGFKMNNNDYISLEIRENFRITDMDNGSNPNFDDTKSNSLNLIFNYSFNI